MTRAPAGTWTSAPAAAIFPPRIRIVPRSIAGPDTGRMRAFVIAIAGPVTGGVDARGTAVVDAGVGGFGRAGRGGVCASSVTPSARATIIEHAIFIARLPASAGP